MICNDEKRAKRWIEQYLKLTPTKLEYYNNTRYFDTPFGASSFANLFWTPDQEDFVSGPPPGFLGIQQPIWFGRFRISLEGKIAYVGTHVNKLSTYEVKGYTASFNQYDTYNIIRIVTTDQSAVPTQLATPKVNEIIDFPLTIPEYKSLFWALNLNIQVNAASNFNCQWAIWFEGFKVYFG